MGGTQEILSTDDDSLLASIKLDDNVTKLFNLSQIKLYLTPIQHAQCLMMNLASALQKFVNSSRNRGSNICF